MSRTIDEARVMAISRTVHEAVRAWAAAHGQDGIPHWNRAPAWMKESTRESVEFTLAHPEAPDSSQHDQWMAQKQRDGWVWGQVKDPAKKTHPMLVSYEQLPDMEKRKDALFKAIVQALA
ncbi:MAG: hypothetical protein GVY06_09050 [Alphaproteobacteria bacterium]|jgi:hypothetical protein|nr:hypothetical protein [Alphaproteobacteria bacterium]